MMIMQVLLISILMKVQASEALDLPPAGREFLGVALNGQMMDKFQKIAIRTSAKTVQKSNPFYGMKIFGSPLTELPKSCLAFIV